MADAQEVEGIINTEVEVPLYMGRAAGGNGGQHGVSVNIPSILDVEEVAFNEENVSGTASWTFANHQLKLSVTGEGRGLCRQQRRPPVRHSETEAEQLRGGEYHRNPAGGLCNGGGR